MKLHIQVCFLCDWWLFPSFGSPQNFCCRQPEFIDQRSWDYSFLSKEDMEAIWLRKQEAAIKRERMMQYSYSHRVSSSQLSASIMLTGYRLQDKATSQCKFLQTRAMLSFKYFSLFWIQWNEAQGFLFSELYLNSATLDKQYYDLSGEQKCS